MRDQDPVDLGRLCDLWLQMVSSPRLSKLWLQSEEYEQVQRLVCLGLERSWEAQSIKMSWCEKNSDSIKKYGTN